MPKRAAKIKDRAGMIAATERAADRVSRDIEYAKAMDADAQKSSRLALQECKACFYPRVHFGRMAGQSTTSAPCSICGVEMHFSDTSTDAYCAGCALEYSLCKHCGGDLNMRQKRRKWPCPGGGDA